MEPIWMGPNGKNFTIETEGWSLAPFAPCLHRHALVAFNGEIYEWKSDHWARIKPSISLFNLDLVKHFDTLPETEQDYKINTHEAYKTREIEDANVLAGMVAKIHENKATALVDAISSTSIQPNIPSLFRWVDTPSKSRSDLS